MVDGLLHVAVAPTARRHATSGVALYGGAGRCEMSEEAGARTSPTPWRRNPSWPWPGHTEDPSAILDANGVDVLPVSEWMNASDCDINLIVRAVDAYPERK